MFVLAKSLVSTRGVAAADNDRRAAVAQLVERVLGKDEAMGSSPISSFRQAVLGGLLWGSYGFEAEFLSNQLGTNPEFIERHGCVFVLSGWCTQGQT